MKAAIVARHEVGMEVSTSDGEASLLESPVPGGGFNIVSGTSVAGAHVSGAWALLKQQQPTAGVSAVLSRLVNSGVNVTDSRNNISKRRIKVDDALSCLQNIPADRWKGEYFNNTNLEEDPVMIRDDGGSFLNMNFGSESPSSICGPGADNFSARWTRTVPLTTNVYRFSVTADDGVRLYVDDQMELDRWNGPAGANTVDVLINGGSRKITLEFREFGGTAQVSLSWTTPCVTDVSADRWRGEYFNNHQLAGSPIMVRDGGNGFLDFNLSWTDNSSFEDGFKIERWNGSSYSQINAVGANVTTYADTGLAHSTTYRYRVGAFNNAGNSGYSNESSATTFTCGYAVAPTGKSFGETGGDGIVGVSAAAGCSWSAVSNASWITITSGDSGVGNGSFYYSVAEYGQRGTRSGTISVAGRTVTITQRGAVPSPPAALDQSAPGAGTGGLTARYFSNTTLSGQPALKRIDPAINFNWAGSPPTSYCRRTASARDGVDNSPRL